MVFAKPSRDGSLGAPLAQERYATRLNAQLGHRELVNEWRKRPTLEVVRD